MDILKRKVDSLSKRVEIVETENKELNNKYNTLLEENKVYKI